MTRILPLLTPDWTVTKERESTLREIRSMFETAYRKHWLVGSLPKEKESKLHALIEELGLLTPTEETRRHSTRTYDFSGHQSGCLEMNLYTMGPMIQIAWLHNYPVRDMLAISEWRMNFEIYPSVLDLMGKYVAMTRPTDHNLFARVPIEQLGGWDFSKNSISGEGVSITANAQKIILTCHRLGLSPTELCKMCDGDMNKLTQELFNE